MRGDASRKSPDGSLGNEAAPRLRRRSGEIEGLLLEAARQVFSGKGYARTTTREIAARAAVAEPLLFRKFGSKSKLFAEAAIHPLAEFLRGFTRDMGNSLPLASPEEEQRRFVEGLYDVASSQRGVLLTLFATSVFEPEVLEAGGAITSIQQALDDLAGVTEKALVQSGVHPHPFNIPLASRSVIGMVLAVALFGDWLLPPGRRKPTRDALLDELTRQVLYGGFNQRPKISARTVRQRTGQRNKRNR